MAADEIEIDLEIHALAAGGDAVGRDADGRVTFVPGAAPGERVRAQIVEAHKKWARAELLEVLRASDARVTPPCPLAGTCGGCPWMHVSRDAQLAAKQAIAAGALRKLIARGLELAPIAAPVPPLGWRRRVRMHYADGVVGFHGARSHELIDVATCAQLDPRLDRAIADARPRLAKGRGEIRGVIGHQGDVHLSIDRSAEGDIEVEPGLRASADDFAQASEAGNAALVAEVVRAVAPRPGQRVLELFGGGGNFTRALLSAGSVVTVNDLRRPDTLPDGARFVGGPAEQAVARTARERFDVVLLDPPRTGALAAVRAIAALPDRPPRIVYVACDPATLARDLEILADAGWVPGRAAVLDLFPQTAHLEIVATLSTAAAARASTEA